MKQKIKNILKKQGYCMVTVNNMLYTILDKQDLFDFGFMCIDKECNEYTFEYSEVGKVE